MPFLHFDHDWHLLSMVSMLMIMSFHIESCVCHSWAGCVDYRGSSFFYQDEFCFAYARDFQKFRGPAITPITNGYQLGTDTGFNQQTSTCQSSLGSPFNSSYSDRCPYAIYEQGAIYCLAWPMKNHAAGSCNGGYMPDNGLQIFRSSVNPTTDPTQQEFQLNEIGNTFGTHNLYAGGDCLGFQRSPGFCLNTDLSMGTGCIYIPPSLPAGHYVFQFHWNFTDVVGAPYRTCFDVEIVPPNSSRSRGTGGLFDAATVNDTLTNNSEKQATGQTCRQNWASVTRTNLNEEILPPLSAVPLPSTLNTPARPPSIPINDTGSIPPSSLPIDTFSAVRVPTQLSNTKIPFEVRFIYNVQGPRMLVVNVLGPFPPPPSRVAFEWYGWGTFPIFTSASGTASFQVTWLTNLTIASGDGYWLNAFLVQKSLFDAFIQNPNAPTPFNASVQLFTQNVRLPAGNALLYADSPSLSPSSSPAPTPTSPSTTLSPSSLSTTSSPIFPSSSTSSTTTSQTGLIIGVVIGALVFATLLILFIIFMMRRHSQKTDGDLHHLTRTEMGSV